jgi:hypothetical protein
MRPRVEPSNAIDYSFNVRGIGVLKAYIVVLILEAGDMPVM